MGSWKTILMLVAVAFAGCADSGEAPAEVDNVEAVPEVEVTETTGAIVGVVVDASITPIPEANIALQGTELTTTSDENGAFAFEDLDAGTYFLSVSKPGYKAIQQSTEVVAGVTPDVLKVLLEADMENFPYYQELVFDGFVECGTSILAVCAVPNIVTSLLGQPPLTNDKFIKYHDIDAPDPLLAQSEMVWDSTQFTGEQMDLLHSHGHQGGFTGTFNSVGGESPLMIQTTAAQIEAEVEDDSTFNPDDWQLVIRVFSGDFQGQPIGVTLQQEFTVYSHVFYNYLPPETWRFTSDGAPPGPQ